jgi:hypothetical protein
VNIIAEEEGAPSVADIIGRPLLAAEAFNGEDLLALKVSDSFRGRDTIAVVCCVPYHWSRTAARSACMCGTKLAK